MSKEVKISYKLFQELCKYHLANEPEWCDIDYIRSELDAKLQKLVNHEQYSAALSAKKTRM